MSAGQLILECPTIRGLRDGIDGPRSGPGAVLSVPGVMALVWGCSLWCHHISPISCYFCGDPVTRQTSPMKDSITEAEGATIIEPLVRGQVKAENE